MSAMVDTYCEEHGSDIHCCVPCANARGVAKVESSDESESVVARPIRAKYESACPWGDCGEDIEIGDRIVAINDLGFVHWHHVSSR